MTAHQPDSPGHRRHRVRRGIAAGAALALVFAGVGFGLGRIAELTGSSTSLDSSATAPQRSDGQLGDGTAPGYGDQDPGYGNALPQAPWDQGGSDGGIPGSPQGSTAGTSTPTQAELTGLVRIDSTMKYLDGEAAGTGMILTPGGEVVTNHHVVAGSTSLTATVMSTGRTYRATVVGTDARDDVAVLQLTGAAGLTPVTVSTTPAAVGDAVTAVGDANGTTDTLTASDGSVSAVNQQITTQDEGNSSGETLTGLIEVRADVVSGDSGGATYDDQGDVVGMTTAASSGSADVTGYAIPIAKVTAVADDLSQGVTSSRYVYGTSAFLGIGLGDGGTTVGQVYDGTAAAKAGLAAGDVITRVDDTSTPTAAALTQTIHSHRVGDRVTVGWTDATGTSHAATVTLGSGPVA